MFSHFESGVHSQEQVSGIDREFAWKYPALSQHIAGLLDVAEASEEIKEAASYFMLGIQFTQDQMSVLKLLKALQEDLSNSIQSVKDFLETRQESEGLILEEIESQVKNSVQKIVAKDYNEAMNRFLRRLALEGYIDPTWTSFESLPALLKIVLRKEILATDLSFFIQLEIDIDSIATKLKG